MFRTVLAVATAALAMGLEAAGAAAEPPATELLFKLRQLDLVSKGSEIVYKFERKTSNENLLGKDFSDQLKLEITKSGDRGARDISMYVFTGGSARDVQNWPDLSTNPLFLWYLDRAVVQLASLSGAEKQYLKGRIRSTFDTHGSVEASKIEVDGKQVDAYRILLKPLKGDPYASKMEGYEFSVLSFVVSDAVPGYFVDMKGIYESPRRGTPRIEETLAFVGAGEKK